MNYLLHMAITRSDITARQTRASVDLVVPFPRTETLKMSLTYQGPLLWNGLPLSIRNNNDLQCFKRSAKHHIANPDASTHFLSLITYMYLCKFTNYYLDIVM